jgi:hypothetical protein
MRKKFQNFSQKASYWLGVVAVGLIIGLSIQFTVAWVNPPASPPTGNVGAPLTTGAGDQTKNGGGITASGPNYGFQGYDTTEGSLGLVGYNVYGLYSHGAGNYGLISYDGDYSSWTHLNYANYGVYTNTPIYSGSYVQAPQLCIGGDCRSSWPTAGSSLPTPPTCTGNKFLQWNGSNWICSSNNACVACPDPCWGNSHCDHQALNCGSGCYCPSGCNADGR